VTVINNHDPETMKKNKDYIIFFVPRSGSTLLTELLVQTGQMGNPQEWLNKNCFDMYKEKYNYNSDNIDEYLKTLKNEQRTANDIFGMEMAHHQFKMLESIEKLWDYFDFATKCIFLRRENCLEQAISLYKSRMTNVWHVRSDRVDIPQVEYNRQELMKSLKVIINEEVNLINFFRHYKIVPLMITYEELRSAHQGVLKKIASFLETDISVTLNVSDINLKKIGKEDEVKSLSEQFIADAGKRIQLEISRLKEAYQAWGLDSRVKIVDQFD